VGFLNRVRHEKKEVKLISKIHTARGKKFPKRGKGECRTGKTQEKVWENAFGMSNAPGTLWTGKKRNDYEPEAP